MMMIYFLVNRYALICFMRRLNENRVHFDLTAYPRFESVAVTVFTYSITEPNESYRSGL
jgi:hypothetical protein